MKSIWRSSALLIVSVFVCVSVIAQSRGYLRGIVVDAQAAPVRGARVVLLVNDRQAVRETFTNERGIFLLDGLKPGEYAMPVEADGLTQTGGAQPVKIEAGRESRIAIPLTVSAVEDAIVVSATRTEARTDETPANAFLISANELARAQRVNLFDADRKSTRLNSSHLG